MSKKILSFVLVFMLIFPLLPISNDAEAAAYAMEITDLKLWKGDKRLASLEEGTIKAEITLTNKGAQVTPFVVAMLCKGPSEDYYQTIDLASNDNTVFTLAQTKTIPLELTCTDVENVFFKLMVFDNKTDLNLISEQRSIPAEKDLTLTDITIGGVPVEGFRPEQTEYEFVIPFPASLPTEYAATLYNPAATLEMEEPSALGEDLKLTVSIENYGEKVYTVTLIEGPDPSVPRLTNVTYNGQPGTVISPMAEGTVSRYSDKPEELFTNLQGITFSENSYYIQPQYEDHDNANFINVSKDWITFDINRSADVYIVSYLSGSFFPWLTGFQAVGTDGVSLVPANSAHEQKLVIENNSIGSANGRKRAYLYKKSYTLPIDGKTTEKVALKGSSFTDTTKTGNYGTYGVIVDFKDPDAEVELPITNVKYNGESISNLTSPVADGITRWSDIAETIPAFGDVVSFSQNSYYIPTKFYDATNETYVDTSKEWISFDISQPAKVYVVSNISAGPTGYFSWMCSEEWKAVGADGSLIDPSSAHADKHLITTGYSGGMNARKFAYLYTKTFIPADGETLTVSLKGTGFSSSSYGAYSVIVDFVDISSEEDPQQTTASVFAGRSFGLKAYAAANAVTELNARVAGGDLCIEGTATENNSPLTVVAQKDGTLDSIDFEKAIYLNSVMTDETGKFSVRIPLYELKGTFQYFVLGSKGAITYDPTGDSTIHSYSLSGSKGKIDDFEIEVKVPYGTDVRGLAAEFSVQENAQVYVGETLQESGVTKNNFEDDVVYRVVADDGQESTYTVSVTVASKKIPSVGGGGGGNIGSVQNAGTSVSVGTSKQEEEKITVNTFADVPADHWAFEAVEKLHAADIVSGFENNVFLPDEAVTREQAVKMLVNAFHLVPQDKLVSFADVPVSEWYAFYVEIAVQNGIVNGISDDLFGTGLSITRQDACTILDRLIRNRGLGFVTAETTTFADEAQIADYAIQPVKNIQSYGLISGYPDGTFQPEGEMTRAEFCALLNRILK